jgi:hypothetical protein
MKLTILANIVYSVGLSYKVFSGSFHKIFSDLVMLSTSIWYLSNYLTLFFSLPKSPFIIKKEIPNEKVE